ncbi:MAG: NAD(P)/FAD-dependent oxidoreductase [Rhodobacteraceae bacterium]|nr:NAD(P)/FAD-dependent oxidoreductase [Paracoccaceae bacterium]
MSEANSTVFDVAVIGSGVVGCAMARRYTLNGAHTVVLEKEPDVLDGASKANSAILHTGFDAPPGSLEQACIASGYREYLDIREALGLPVLKTGALVVAWDKPQLEQLESLLKKARQNGVPDVRPMSKAEILAQEPALATHLLGGFSIPGEYLIDPWATAHAYLLQALANGAELRRNAEVLTGVFDGEIWTLSTPAGVVRARQVINCAGLFGDILDQRLLGQSRFSIHPRKGQFVVFDKSAAALLQAIVLPVPSKTTKGVVLFRTIFGNLAVGPTAEEQDSRTDASTDRTTLQGLRQKGIEMLPALARHEITATYAGLRPASNEQDYRIITEPQKNYISVGGIRSTGLSAALGIASHVAALNTGAEVRYAPLSAPAIPLPDRLSDYHERDWQVAGNGGIICHCEKVTKREILAALDGPMPPATLQGLKRRTRVTMGRCQGFYCTPALAALTKGRLDPALGEPDE